MTSPNYGYLHRGTVVAAEPVSGGYTVRIAALAPGRIMGPFLSMAADLTPGDRVALASIGTSRDDLVIVGRLPGEPVGYSLDGWLTSYAARMSIAQPYREPTALEAANGVLGVERLALSGTDATGLLAPLGYTIVTDYDRASGRSFALAYNEAGTERAWGAFLVDLSQPIRLVIQCPHPVADQHTEAMALEHWRQTPGALLVMAGAHRDATGAQQGGYAIADVCKQVNSLFHQVCASYASRNVPAVQWHGFADASAAGLDKIVATGSGNAGPSARRIAEELADAGFSVGRGWDSSGNGTGLIGLTNVQGDDALARGVTWTHIENNATTRNDPAARARAVAAVVAAQPEVAGVARLLAEAKSGQFPKPVGSANTAGTSPYGARVDHIHAERQATLDRITALEGKIVLPVANAASRPTTGLYDGMTIFRTDKRFHEVYSASVAEWRVPYMASVPALADIEFPYLDQMALQTSDRMIYRYVNGAWLGVQYTTTGDNGHAFYVQIAPQTIEYGGSGTKIAFPSARTATRDVTRVGGSQDFILNRAGLWLLETSMSWGAAGGATFRNLAIVSSDQVTTYAADSGYNNGGGFTNSVSVVRRLPAGAQVSARGYQEQGGPISTAPGGDDAVHFSMTWLRP